MMIKQLKLEEKMIEIVIEGEGHTFLNILTQTLQENPDVNFAAYIIDHPKISHPRLVVSVSDGTPFEAIMEATKKLEEKSQEFIEKFTEAFKKYKDKKEE
ncbi:MAG: RpoL/Rpb11 RNA polymerase subunit family protein [Candidatus Wukongarchaeota archaeon]|jgi:DNA-directed RNA polymerase subunit L|nr:DNA-directed RNA polymerase subunit L [Candidatus Wukongarchaeota archaeon]